MIKKEALKNSNQVKLTFVLPGGNGRSRVTVVGDFNQWNSKATPIAKRNNGTLSASVTLPAGQRVRFRYYSNSGEWFNGEAADSYEPGEYGADNCIVLI